MNTTKTTFRLLPFNKEKGIIQLLYNYRYKTIDPSSQKVTYCPLAYSTGITIEKTDWDKDESRVKKTHPQAKTLNYKLGEIDVAINKVYERFQDEGVNPSPEQLRLELDMKLGKTEAKAPVEKQSFILYIEDFCTKLKERGEVNTRIIDCNYLNTVMKLKQYEAYMRETKKNFNLTFDIYTMDVHLDFIGWVRKTGYMKKKVHHFYKQNNVWKFNKNIKKFLNEAKEEGIKLHIDTTSEKMRQKKEVADTIYLDLDELEILHKFKVETKRMQVVKDLFIVNSFTAVRFSDTKKLNEISISNHTKPNGEVVEFLKVTTQKTGEKVTLPCFRPVKEIYDRYQGKFPKSPNEADFNRLIKKIVKAAGIVQDVTIASTINGKVVHSTHPKYSLVTSHTGRRSCLSNLHKIGLNLATLMKLSGHRSSVNLLAYLKASDMEHLDMIYDVVKSKAPNLI